MIGVKCFLVLLVCVVYAGHFGTCRDRQVDWCCGWCCRDMHCLVVACGSEFGGQNDEVKMAESSASGEQWYRDDVTVELELCPSDCKICRFSGAGCDWL